jgi:hypothetical protein
MNLHCNVYPDNFLFTSQLPIIGGLVYDMPKYWRGWLDRAPRNRRLWPYDHFNRLGYTTKNYGMAWAVSAIPHPPSMV